VDAVSLLAHKATARVLLAPLLLVLGCPLIPALGVLLSVRIVDAMSLLSHGNGSLRLWATGMTFQMHCMHFIVSSIIETELAPTSSIVTQHSGATTVKSCFDATCRTCHPFRLNICFHGILLQDKAAF